MQAISETLTLKRYNVNKTKTNNVNNVTGNDVKRIAHHIADKLDDYSSLNFFMKVAWQIPEHQLMLFLENAQSPKVRNPRAVFTWQCNQLLRNIASL